MNSNLEQARIDSFTPAAGSVLVNAGKVHFLIGQPPEVLKGLMRSGTNTVHALILSDTRERDGSLLHNVEFVLYHFLFVSEGLARGEKLALIGPQAVIDQVRRIIQITLLGPDESQLDSWGTSDEQKYEWLEVAKATALKSAEGTILTVDDLLSYHPFANDEVEFRDVSLRHLGVDHYRSLWAINSMRLGLSQCPSFPPIHSKRTIFPAVWQNFQ